GGEAGGGFLVRDGDIEAASALREEIAHHRIEVRRCGIDGVIGEVLAGLGREARVDERRATVADGMADDGVTIGSTHAAAILRPPPHGRLQFSDQLPSAAASWLA